MAKSARPGGKGKETHFNRPAKGAAPERGGRQRRDEGDRPAYRNEEGKDGRGFEPKRRSDAGFSRDRDQKPGEGRPPRRDGDGFRKGGSEGRGSKSGNTDRREGGEGRGNFYGERRSFDRKDGGEGRNFSPNRGANGRFERNDRTDRSDRPDRGDRPDRNQRFDRSDRPDRGDRPERGDRPDRNQRFERNDRPDRGDRPERGDRPDRNQRFDRSDRGDRNEASGRSDRFERGDRPGRNDRGDRYNSGDRGNRSEGAGRGDRFNRDDRPRREEGDRPKRSFGDKPGYPQRRKDGEAGDDRRSSDKPRFRDGDAAPRKHAAGPREDKFRGDEGGRRSFSKRDEAPRRRGPKPVFDDEEFRPASNPAKPGKWDSEAKNGPMTLNKYLAHSGVSSRRDAAAIIKAGKVEVNGKVLDEPGYRVQPGDTVFMEGKELRPQRNFVYVLLNKPKDFITTTEDEKGRRTVMELVSGATEDRLYPVGRLDRNTTGVLLLTNDGDLAQKLSHPKYESKKIYQVSLDKDVTKRDFEKILEGVTLEDGVATVDRLAYLDSKSEIGLEIHSGRNRIVRRIFEHLGYDVVKLDRVMYAGLTKKNVSRGKWRFLTDREVIQLKHFRS